ncbi:MAG: hypothetical protein JO036_13640 [Candidatus Eremiobacteraeota bacterium]|nr:hypothetical protein [Candidatus Eremiobacteraeota bacterium]
MDNYEALPDGSHIASAIEEYDGATVYLLFAFDELLRNPDRKPGDILTMARGGRPRRFLAIDHGNAFTGSHWDSAHLLRSSQGNATDDSRWVFRGLNDKSLAAVAADRIVHAAADVREAVNEAAAASGLADVDRASAHAFLEIRRDAMVSLTLAAVAKAAETI